MAQRKRGERESLNKLVHSIMEAVVKAYPKRDDEARQDLAKTYFVNALLDESQQRHIYTREVDTLDRQINWQWCKKMPDGQCKSVLHNLGQG